VIIRTAPTRRAEKFPHAQDTPGGRCYFKRSALDQWRQRSGVCSYAIRHLGATGSNPVALLISSERPRDDQKEKRILDADELARLIEAVEPKYRLIFELAAETGARLSETLALIWREVDFEQQTISITRQIDRQGQRVEPKTKRSILGGPFCSGC
jgi:integrase